MAYDLLQRALKPYKPDCRYLKKAWVEFNTSLASFPGSLLARGNFSIPESCYITDTGHFNAIEFNICYNQLGYYFLAECIQNKLIPNFDWDLEDYDRLQLSHILIVELSSSFRRPMCSHDFNGFIEIQEITKKKNMLLLKTSCGFGDSDKTCSSGKVVLAVMNK